MYQHENVQLTEIDFCDRIGWTLIEDVPENYRIENIQFSYDFFFIEGRIENQVELFSIYDKNRNLVHRFFESKLIKIYQRLDNNVHFLILEKGVQEKEKARSE